MYTFIAMPLSKELKTSPVYICPCNSGTSSPEIVDDFNLISQKLEKNGFDVKFWATDGDKAFDQIHQEWFKKVNEVFLKDISFRDKILLLKNYKRIPVSDPYHLLKNGRAHLLNHPIMLDNVKMKCVNVSLLQEAVKLGLVISDKSSIGAMKDSYIIKLFSWETFIKLLQAQRFDGALYIAPFMFMLHVIKSETLNKSDRFEMLSLAIRQFYFYLNQVEDCSDDALFTPSFHSNTSVGTLFGTRDFIIRCINTCVACAISIEISDMNFPLAFSRVGTYGVECHYGKVRILSNFNHTFENALKAAVNVKILNRLTNELGYKIKIRNRCNNAGCVLSNDILHGPCAPVDFSYLYDTLFYLFESIKMSDEQILRFECLVNSYSEYMKITNYPQVKIASAYGGTAPHYRYVTNSYVQSLLPIPQMLSIKSPFDFFISDRKMNKKINKIHNQQWFIRLLCAISGIKTVEGEIMHISFPRLYPTMENAEIYNTISYWLETMLKQLPGEVNDVEDLDIEPKNDEKEDSIIRLNFFFQRYEDSNVPCCSDGSELIMDLQENDNEYNEEHFPEQEMNQIEPKSLEQISDDDNHKISQIVQAFFDHRIDLIKSHTKEYVLSRIYSDMESIIGIINSIQDDYLAVHLKNIDLSYVSDGPINNKKKVNDDLEEISKIDEFSFEQDEQQDDDEIMHDDI